MSVEWSCARNVVRVAYWLRVELCCALVVMAQCTKIQRLLQLEPWWGRCLLGLLVLVCLLGMCDGGVTFVRPVNNGRVYSSTVKLQLSIQCPSEYLLSLKYRSDESGILPLHESKGSAEREQSLVFTLPSVPEGAWEIVGDLNCMVCQPSLNTFTGKIDKGGIYLFYKKIFQTP